MYCEKCGKENDKGARFCEYCGAELSGEETIENVKNVQEKTKKKSIPNKKLILLVIPVVIVAIIGVMLFGGYKKEKEYETLIAAAERYYEELDYETAEATYLEAIAIDPKKAEAYLQLAKVYVRQGENEKAIAILEEAKENVEENPEEVEELSKEIEGYISYKWIVEPEIEADNILYLSELYTDGLYGGESLNESFRQIMSPYAIIQKDNVYGAIDLSGSLLGGMDYMEAYGYNSRQYFERIVPAYEPEWGTEWTTYTIYEGRMSPVLGLGDWGASAFYYSNGLHEINEGNGFEMEAAKPTEPIPVKQSQQMYKPLEWDDPAFISGEDWWADLPGNYAIWHNGELKTDFIYEKCGSSEEGMLAVCQDGKWGYVNTEGQVVIPLEYDASWTGLIIKEWHPYMEKQIGDGYCYAFSDGYIPLVKDGVWELRDLEGKLVIPAGRFEEIRPVYEGKCWVKEKGKWGVIELGVFETDEVPDAESLSDVVDGIWLQKSPTSAMQFDFSSQNGKAIYYDTISQEAEYETTYSVNGSELQINLVDLDGNGTTKVYYDLKYSEEGAARILEIEYSSKNSDVDTSKLYGMDETLEGTYVQIKEEKIREVLGVPDDLDAEVVIYNPSYWETGESYLIYVMINVSDECVASASLDAFTGHAVKDIWMYGE